MRLDEGSETGPLVSRLNPIDPDARSPLASPTAQALAGNLEAQIEEINQTIRGLVRIDQSTGLDTEGQELLAQKKAERTKLRRERIATLAGEQGEPEAIDGSPPDELAVVGGILPIEAEITRGSFRDADTASCTLNWKDAPFDPRLMRASAIEIVIGVVAPENFDAGIHGERRADGTPVSVVEDPGGDRPPFGVTRFVGFIDKWDTHFSSDGATVTVQARDVSSILIDTLLPPGVTIDLERPINEGVADLLEAFPATKGIPVTYGPDRMGTGPLPGASIPEHRKSRGKRGRCRNAGTNTKLWDHVTDVCTMTGVVPTADVYGINIQEARTLFGQADDVPRMVWGQNITELSFSRNLAGFKNPTVEVRCVDGAKLRTRWARYPTVGTGLGKSFGVIGESDPPTTPARANKVPPTGANPSEDIRVYNIRGVTDGETLVRIARGLFEETARQEIDGSFSTRDPSSFGLPFELGDLLEVKAGDPIRIEFDQRREGAQVADIVTGFEGRTQAERRRVLLDAGWSEAVADQFSRLSAAANFQTVFRVQGVQVEWDNEDGLNVHVDFNNYIVIRDDPQTADAIEADPSALADATAGDRQSAQAQELRGASRDRRRLADQRAAGQYDGDEQQFEQDYANAQQRERNAARVNEDT